MARVRIWKAGAIVLAVPAVLAVGSGAARAGEVPRFDPPGTAVLAGSPSFPGTVGTADLDAFTFGTTPVTAPLATAIPSQPSLVADIPAQPAGKGDKGAAGKVSIGGDCLIGMAVCKGPLALLPGITNPVFFDGVPGPVRDAVWRAMATYNKETVVRFFEAPDRNDATVVVRMRPFAPETLAHTGCSQPTWHLLISS